MKRTVGDIDFVVPTRGYGEADVVAGAANQCSLRIDRFPVFSRVIGPPHRTLVFGLHESIDAIRIGRCNCNIDLPHGRMRQALFIETRPLGSAIVRNINCAASATAELTPGVHFQLPHAGDKRVRVVCIQGQSRAADVFTSEQHPLPMLPTVGRAVHAAILLRPSRPSQHAGKDNIRIRRVDHDPANTSGIGQPHVVPSVAGIGRFVDPVAHYVAVANDPGLPGACPHRVRLRGRHCEGTDRGDGLLVRDWRPAIPAVH